MLQHKAYLDVSMMLLASLLFSMANNKSQQQPFSFDSRSLAQWVVTYAVVVWFLLEVLDFLVGTYGGSTSIVKTATTFGITSFSLLLTVYWFAGRDDQKPTILAASLALLSSLFIVLTSNLRTAIPNLDWIATLATAAVIAVALTAMAVAIVRSRPESTEAGESEEISIAPPNSIAVMPFRSLSADQEDNFFADGLSEEILNSLAKIPDLQVASRNASFAPSIGDNAKNTAEQLDVHYLLEGSVRASALQGWELTQLKSTCPIDREAMVNQKLQERSVE